LCAPAAPANAKVAQTTAIDSFLMATPIFWRGTTIAPRAEPRYPSGHGCVRPAHPNSHGTGGMAGRSPGPVEGSMLDKTESKTQAFQVEEATITELHAAIRSGSTTVVGVV